MSWESTHITPVCLFLELGVTCPQKCRGSRQKKNVAQETGTRKGKTVNIYINITDIVDWESTCITLTAFLFFALEDMTHKIFEERRQKTETETTQQGTKQINDVIICSPYTEGATTGTAPCAPRLYARPPYVRRYIYTSSLRASFSDRTWPQRGRKDAHQAAYDTTHGTACLRPFVGPVRTHVLHVCIYTSLRTSSLTVALLQKWSLY